MIVRLSAQLKKSFQNYVAHIISNWYKPLLSQKYSMCTIYAKDASQEKYTCLNFYFMPHKEAMRLPNFPSKWGEIIIVFFCVGSKRAYLLT